ncbi:hypothetical protein THAOC_06953 [Thalassiosira oceanica]|uniref:Uncharacterized protein n=1 Tax=Thalassiosira oceanica TaxID=159749 RepID=K0SYV9_THAOC|nr:hypothetical protein THAOC_06953 [Thalassiosira oceanica]|eukprot:EJK71588.1 hypothetical protein THAOC_06953 [Thalassiosira oceanica]
MQQIYTVECLLTGNPIRSEYLAALADRSSSASTAPAAPSSWEGFPSDTLSGPPTGSILFLAVGRATASAAHPISTTSSSSGALSPASSPSCPWSSSHRWPSGRLMTRLAGIRRFERWCGRGRTADCGPRQHSRRPQGVFGVFPSRQRITILSARLLNTAGQT